MRSLGVALGLVTVLFSACSSTDSRPRGSVGGPGSAGGASGEAGAGGVADAAGAAGALENAGGAADAAGSAGADGVSPCVQSGHGQIELVVTGLPEAIAASVTVSGAGDLLLSESTTLGDLPGGPYTVSAKRVYDTHPLVRTVYAAQLESPAFCLSDGATQTVTVDYSKVASSNQLWTINRGADTPPLLGFAPSALLDSVSTATSTVNLPVGSSMAFDQDGNLWAAGATAAEPTVTRYAAAWLSGVGIPRDDFAFKLAIDCVPAIKGIALDEGGNVWLSTCDKRLLRVDRPDATPGAGEEAIHIAAGVTFSGFTEQNEDLAFDSAGNLWVAAGGQVLRFDRARLASDDADAPDLVLDVTTEAAPPYALAANFLAFDVDGNLWASDFVGKAVFEIAKAALGHTGRNTVVAKVRVAVDVQAVISRPAFDDEGSLWLSLAAGKFGKLTPAQLAVSSSPAAPTTPAVVISSSELRYADGMAFFPAARGLPLASAQP